MAHDMLDEDDYQSYLAEFNRLLVGEIPFDETLRRVAKLYIEQEQLDRTVGQLVEDGERVFRWLAFEQVDSGYFWVEQNTFGAQFVREWLGPFGA